MPRKTAEQTKEEATIRHQKRNIYQIVRSLGYSIYCDSYRTDRSTGQRYFTCSVYRCLPKDSFIVREDGSKKTFEDAPKEIIDEIQKRYSELGYNVPLRLTNVKVKEPVYVM